MEQGSADARRERLWAKVEVGEPDECWPFTGAWRSRFGYGRIRDGAGRGVQAHKAAYELLVGPVPAGLWLLHECDNPAVLQPASPAAGDGGGEPARPVRARRIREEGCVTGPAPTPKED